MPEKIGALDNDQLVIRTESFLHVIPTREMRPGKLLSSDAYHLLELARNYELTQLWIHPSVTVEPTYGGWNVQERDRGSWWVHAFIRGGAAVDLVQPRLNSSQGGGWWAGAWSAAANAGDLADAVIAFRRELGLLPYRGPSTTGTRLLLALHREKSADAALEKLGKPAPPQMAGRCEPELTWTRAFHPQEIDYPYVHAYDKHAQFLAACSSVPLGIGNPVHVRLPDLDRYRLPGYWWIDPETLPAQPADIPSLAPGIRAGNGWVTTPTLALLGEFYGPLRVEEGWYWPHHARYLEPWYKTIRDARNEFRRMEGAGPEIAAQAIKPLYTQTIGLLAAAPSDTWDRTADPFYRPDWREMIVATARANTMRNLTKILARAEALPVAIGADCMYFAAEERDPVEYWRNNIPSLQLGDGVGQYGLKDAGIPMREFREHYRPGALWEAQVWLNRRRGEPEEVPA